MIAFWQTYTIQTFKFWNKMISIEGDLVHDRILWSVQKIGKTWNDSFKKKWPNYFIFQIHTSYEPQWPKGFSSYLDPSDFTPYLQMWLSTSMSGPATSPTMANAIITNGIIATVYKCSLNMSSTSTRGGMTSTEWVSYELSLGRARVLADLISPKEDRRNSAMR